MRAQIAPQKEELSPFEGIYGIPLHTDIVIDLEALEYSVGVSPRQEGIVLMVKQQTQGFWIKQKQAHIDYQAHLKSK